MVIIANIMAASTLLAGVYCRTSRYFAPRTKKAVYATSSLQKLLSSGDLSVICPFTVGIMLAILTKVLAVSMLLTKVSSSAFISQSA